MTENSDLVQQHDKKLAVMDEKLGEIKKTTDKIWKALNGNGSTGLITQAELNKAAIRRAWWFIGAIVGVVLGCAIRVIAG